MAESAARHHASGLHYVHVFPDPHFAEIKACYAAARDLPWMTVVGDSDVRPAGPLVGDASAFFVFWGWRGDFPRPAGRSALHYMESLADPARMLQNQRDLFGLFRDEAGAYDIVFGHTPAAVAALAPFCRRAALAPVGHEPEVSGAPDWSAPKEFAVGFYGTPVGRREWVLPELRGRFGAALCEFNAWGRERRSRLDRCRLALHVAHSDDPSFATTRLWQTAASSAALAVEESDAWPAEPGAHLVTLPRARRDRPWEFAAAVEAALERPDLPEIAGRAHAHLAAYTVRRCMEEWVVPASAGAP